jgi:hypothetical protein
MIVIVIYIHDNILCEEKPKLSCYGNWPSSGQVSLNLLVSTCSVIMIIKVTITRVNDFVQHFINIRQLVGTCYPVVWCSSNALNLY